MNTPNDGGPAFPTIKGLQQQVRASGPDYLKAEVEGGMSLRDWFAGQALAAMNINSVIIDAKLKGLCVQEVADCITETCWVFADAMLAARDGKEGA